MIALDAHGGTGKTFVLSNLLSYVRSQGKIALATATSGIAANILEGGRTLHYRMKVPVEEIHDKSLCSIKDNSNLAKLLQKTSLLVIDECTMASRLVYETCDRSLRKILNNDKPFGGITTV